jgi:hypothetical protein
MLLPEEQSTSPSTDNSSPTVSTQPVSLKTSVVSTSSTLLHRYYHNVSLQDTNVWSTAMACTLLAAKLLEVPNMADLRKIITVYAHLYRKRIVVQNSQAVADVSNDNDNNNNNNNNNNTTTSDLWASLMSPNQSYSQETYQEFIKPSGMSPAGPIYKEWKDVLEQTEHCVLRALGFLLHWIPNQMPHKYLGPMLLDIQENTAEAAGNATNVHFELAQRAWDYCNDSHYLDLATRVPPHVIAAAAIFLARLDTGLSSSMILNADNGMDGADVSMVCNALLGLRLEIQSRGSEVWIAAIGFVRSLELGEGSFNDPSSFLWEMEESRWNELTKSSGST